MARIKQSTFINWGLTLVSVFVALAAVEGVLRLINARGDSIRQGQEAFIETYSIPDSYGIPRPHTDFDLRPFFPNGRFIKQPIPVQTNSFGMRMREVSLEKKEGVVRVAALGDSSTFGWMVLEEKTYPRVLEQQLNEQGGTQFEVLNFGVPGYTSFHGRVHFERWVKPFRPDILLFAYGFNDSFESHFEEKTFYARLKQAGLTEGLSTWQRFLYDHSALARWVINRLTSPVKDRLLREHMRREENQEWHRRVSKKDYQENLSTMIEQGRQWGAKSILLNLNLPNTWVKKPLAWLSGKFNLPLLDVQDLFIRHAEKQAFSMVKELNLLPEGIYFVDQPDSHSILLRVYVPNEMQVEDAIYVVGNPPALGDWQPNTVALNDSGQYGDRRAGDNVWSRQFDVEEDMLLNYAFTNSGPRGQWSEDRRTDTGSQKALRHYYFFDAKRLNPGEMWRSPLHWFGRVPYEDLLLPNDPIHPNAKGHAMIAEHLEPMVRNAAALIKGQ